MPAKGTAAQARGQDQVFGQPCNFQALKDRLPLVWPRHPHIPQDHLSLVLPLPGWGGAGRPATWTHLTDFDLVLRLVDFSPLRDTLADLLGWTSAKGRTPFDPVSFFLLVGWPPDQRLEPQPDLKKVSDNLFLCLVDN